MPNKYNFEFNTHTPRGRADITIYATGLCYVSTRAVKEHDLLNGKFHWGIDREKKVLALKRVECGRAISVEEGVLVLVPLTATAQG